MSIGLRAGIVLACAVLLAHRPAVCQRDGGARLVRCAEGGSAPCMSTRLVLERADAADPGQWSGSLGAIRFREVDVRATMERPLVLLVLVDVSGSMAGAGIQQTRSALRTLFRDLGESPAQVAVVPFGSRGVADSVRAARFGTPAHAEARIDGLPEPAGNTGLYSAVQAGAESLAARLRAAPADAQGVLLVLTDGRNEVGRPGDERGLLTGGEGRARAVDAVRRSGVRVWMIGIGSGVDAAELTTLAGPLGTAHTVGFDPARLGRTLSQLRRSLANVHAVTAVLPPRSRALLARGETAFRVEYGHRSRVVRWRPPLIALPAFTGTAAPSRPLASPGAADGGVAARIGPVFAFFAILLALLWWVVPSLIWPAPRVPRAAKRRFPRVSTGDRRLRSGVREAPPRRPSDITVALARRVVVDR